LNGAQANILEVILQKSKYLAILTVVITLLCALVLYLITSVAAIMAIYEALTSGDWSTTTTKIMAVTLLQVVLFNDHQTGSEEEVRPGRQNHPD
jgi:uncharacterized membrane protein YqhA